MAAIQLSKDDPNLSRNQDLKSIVVHDPLQIYVVGKIYKISIIDVISQNFSCDVSFEVWFDDPDREDVSKMQTIQMDDSAIPHLTKIHNAETKEDDYEPYMTQYPRSANKPYGNMRVMQRQKLVCSCSVDLHTFPFDKQELPFAFRLPRSADKNNVLNLVSLTLSQECLTDWVLVGPFIRDDDPTNTNLVRTAIVQAKRTPHYYVVNICSLIFILTSICTYVFACDVTSPADRASVSMTMMLTSVAFKFLVDDRLPRLSYATLLDKYMYFCFFFQLLIIVENAAIIFLPESFDKVAWDHTFASVAILIWLSINFLLVMYVKLCLSPFGCFSRCQCCSKKVRAYTYL